MELLGTKDVRMVAKVLEHPDFVMPEGFERALPAAMAEIVVAKHAEGERAGQYKYRPTARIRATMALARMLQINEERHQQRGGDTHIHIGAAAGDVHVAVQRLQQAGISEEELRVLAASREIVKRVEQRPEQADPAAS